MLISIEGVWLHSNWSRRYWHWHWHWIWIWRWSYHYWMIHCSPWTHSPELLLILTIQLLNIRFKRSFLFSKIIFLTSQLKINKMSLLPWLFYVPKASWWFIKARRENITWQDSSFSVVYSSLSLLTWEVRSCSNWMVSPITVALSFLCLSSGSAFQSRHMQSNLIMLYQFSRSDKHMNKF